MQLQACDYIRTLPNCTPKRLPQLLPDADSEGKTNSFRSSLSDTSQSALDLLSQLLTFDPTIRIDVPSALTHAYVSTYHDESDEPTCPETFENWEQVESLQTIEELREAVTREIGEFRVEVRTVMNEENEVDDPVETLVSEAGQSSRPIYSDLGISPHTTSMPFPRAARESTPPTPMSALSEDSFGNPISGRSSRRTSGHGIHVRRPSSFLFSSPLGAGMTPMASQRSLPSEGGAFWNGRRSRAPSAAGEFTSLRPLIRQLSTVGLGDGKPLLGGEKAEMDVGEVPPMTVSPGDTALL